VSDTWILNASPVITMAKAGYLHLFEQLAAQILIPESVADEILAAPSSDPAREALEGGWGERASAREIPSPILEWGLGRGESGVLALALERRGCWAVLDDAAARRCARAMEVPLIGTLGAVLQARRLGLIESAAHVLLALRAAGLRLDDKVTTVALKRAVGEDWWTGPR
jgi:predicted nucleic acid-binding protein